MVHWFARLIGWVYFNRVPLLTLAVIAALGPVGAGSSLLGNIINMSDHSWNEFFFVGFDTVVACASALVSLNVNNCYGGARFGVKPFPTNCWVRLGLFFLAAIPAAILLISVETHTPLGRPGAIPLGVLTALILLVVIKILEFGYTDPAIVDIMPKPEFYVFPFDILPRFGPWLIRLLERRFWLGGIVSRILCWLQKPLYLFLRHTPEGYIVPGKSQFLPGHVFAMLFWAVAFGFYLRAGGTLSDRIDHPWASLIYILMFLTVFGWALAGTSFFLDRFRIPLLFPAILFLTLAGNNGDSDHFYRVQRRLVEPSPTPAEIMKSRIDAETPLVLVATAGGGIQAAAWTAKVLDKLTEMNPYFKKSLVLISGASGGSVGAMFYTQTAYVENRTDSATGAMQPSLEYVAWGLLKPDVARTIVPFLGDKTRDRGLALEQSWEERLHLKATLLSDWSKLVRDRKLPALIFNSTAIESGDPILFSTSSPGKGDCVDGNEHHALPRFHEYYNRTVDLNVVTAARMGATFPYVSPAAKPSGGVCPGLHLVDGGYYDNYGVGSLVDWLEDGLSDKKLDRLPENVLVLRIRSFLDDVGRPPTPDRGWFFQSWAPILGLYNMRESAQRRNADRLLAAVRTRWSQESPKDTIHCKVRSPVNIRVVDVVYPEFPYSQEQGQCNQPPLSWRLNPRQQKCISEAWDNVTRDAKKNECLQDVKTFLAGGAPVPAGCDALEQKTE